MSVDTNPSIPRRGLVDKVLRRGPLEAIATAIGGIMRVDRMKNSRSSFSGTLKRENA